MNVDSFHVVQVFVVLVCFGAKDTVCVEATVSLTISKREIMM